MAWLLRAALLARSASAAARPGALSHHSQHLYPASNSTPVMPTLTPSSDETHSYLAPKVPSSSLAVTALATEPSNLETRHGALSGAPTSSTAPSIASPAGPASSRHDISTQLLSNVSRLPTRPLSLSPEATVTVTINCTPEVDSHNCTKPVTINRSSSYSEQVSTSIDHCTSIPEDRPITHFSVVYTSTVTFFGNRSDYTPPYESLVTPNYCMPTHAPAFAPARISGIEPSDHFTAAGVAPAAWEDTVRHAPRPSFTFITTDKNPSVAFPSDAPPRFTPTRARLVKDHGNANHKPAAGDGSLEDEDSGSHKKASGGGSGGSGDTGKQQYHGHPSIINHGSGIHKPAAGVGDGVGVDVKPVPQAFPTPDAVRMNEGRFPSFKITARGNQVTINDQTFLDLGPSQTSTVTADGAPFTISPNAIVGAGATVQKPVPAGTVVSVATPTSDMVGGLPVTLKGSEAVVGHATLTMVEGGTATVVDGRKVSLKPGTLVVGKQTLAFQPVMPPRETEMLVKGGELLTAVGRSIVVIHSTTFTYGPGVTPLTQIVNGDTVTVGPSGVSLHGIVVGGPSANPAETRFEVVGGATITRVAPSLAIINGATFIIGPGTHWTTTVIAGETLTVGPTGVVMSTVTFKYPFGLAVTSTVRPTGTHLDDLPVETGDIGDQSVNDEESMSSLVSPDSRVGCMALSIAFGVLFLA